jgi:hypothetical protein
MYDHNSQSVSVCGHIKSFNILFQLRNCVIPGNLLDKENIHTKIVKAREQEEIIARQRSPITHNILLRSLTDHELMHQKTDLKLSFVTF